MDRQKFLAELNAQEDTLMKTLGIVFTEIGEDYLKGIMPVTARLHQPSGLLHGGANVALAESLGSCLSYLLVQEEGKVAVGTGINANHLKAVSRGVVTGTARVLRKGKNLHFVEVEIRDEEENLVCHTTMTNMIVPKK